MATKQENYQIQLDELCERQRQYNEDYKSFVSRIERENFIISKNKVLPNKVLPNKVVYALFFDLHYYNDYIGEQGVLHSTSVGAIQLTTKQVQSWQNIAKLAIDNQELAKGELDEFLSEVMFLKADGEWWLQNHSLSEESLCFKQPASDSLGKFFVPKSFEAEDGFCFAKSYVEVRMTNTKELSKNKIKSVLKSID